MKRVHHCRERECFQPLLWTSLRTSASLKTHGDVGWPVGIKALVLYAESNWVKLSQHVCGKSPQSCCSGLTRTNLPLFTSADVFGISFKFCWKWNRKTFSPWLRPWSIQNVYFTHFSLLLILFQQNNLFIEILIECCLFGSIHGRLISGNVTSVGNENLYCQYTAESRKQEVVISWDLFEVSLSAIKLWPLFFKNKTSRSFLELLSAPDFILLCPNLLKNTSWQALVFV